ncbi:hypothetical protein [Flammeovirga sp. EKP202]|uniref:hypothetical protein n=1 Tax=Flammeovirga sp. EKP202 TaxID=2770592 RepID=UPI00165F3C7A|nr:hypothetical protein [Flammeovirga sp. EKP202]MBD0404688.1 hypothetical protein [Flammeovirga sp. EKP202]
MKTLKFFGKIFLIFLGCIGGYIIGYEIGELQGNTGSASLGAFIIGLLGIPIGGLIVYFIIRLVSKTKQQSDVQ